MTTKLTTSKKFNLDKIEVAKLNKSQMKNVFGGLAGDLYTHTDNQEGGSTHKCDEIQNNLK